MADTDPIVPDAGGYSFIDSQQRLVDYPETWQTATLGDLSALAVGDCVKVGLQRDSGGTGERFWTIVTALEDSLGNITAEVNNDLVEFTELKVGQPIVFQRKHIIEMWERSSSAE